jgi:Cu+-exporting ATPase
VSATDLAVLAGGTGLIVFLVWFFFGPKRGKAAVIRAGVQEATVLVAGAHNPYVLTVRAGTPVRLRFDRQEATDCSNGVVLSDFGISRVLVMVAGRLLRP